MEIETYGGEYGKIFRKEGGRVMGNYKRKIKNLVDEIEDEFILRRIYFIIITMIKS